MHTIYISITLISELHDFFYKVQFKKIKKLPKVGVGENSRIQRTIGGISEYGYLTIVEYLIEKQNDIDIKGRDGKTPLHYACLYGHLPIVEYISKGENIEANNEY